ncbi:MAG TPA: DegV family protein [Actinomycetota bacterium]|nr:DegV family protein [Actinomycetota bacterium]
MVVVVTDSAANLPAEVARDLGIVVVPLSVRFGEEVVPDDGDPDELYGRLSAGELASTAAPSVGDWVAGFEGASNDEIVCVTLAGALSSTHHEAVLAAQRTPARIEVVDSGTASMAEGFVAIEAARAARDGAALDAVVRRAREVAGRVQLQGAIESFEHLRRTGRVTRFQAYAATALSIRPLFRLSGGVIEPAGRARTRSRALAMLADAAAGVDGAKGPLHVAALHAAAEADARSLLDRIRDRTDVAEEFCVPATPVIGASTGPGLVGAAWWRG